VVVQLEDPVGVGGPPVVAVAVDDHGRVRGDPEPAGQLGEGLRADEVARDRVVEVGLPVELLRAGHVADVVQQDVLVRLEDANVRVLSVLGDPLRRHERVRVRIALGHPASPPRSEMAAPIINKLLD
jgi:hypothetical protein